MGLFGGFKAKLIGRNRRPVSKNIVCTKFNTFNGEFDQPIDNIPSTSNTNLGKNDVIKEKRRPSRPEIKTVFSENGVKSNGDVAKPSPSTNSVVQTTPEIPTEYTKTTTTTTKPLKTKAPEIPHTPAPIKKPSEEILPVVDDDDDNIPPTLLKTRSPLFSLTNDSDSDDDGNFKIHINHNIDKNHSEDEDSSDHDHDDVDTPVNYSSQAASIFFGEDAEPEIRRPRNVIFNHDNDDDDNISEGSSASA